LDDNIEQMILEGFERFGLSSGNRFDLLVKITSRLRGASPLHRVTFNLARSRSEQRSGVFGPLMARL